MNSIAPFAELGSGIGQADGRGYVMPSLTAGGVLQLSDRWAIAPDVDFSVSGDSSYTKGSRRFLGGLEVETQFRPSGPLGNFYLYLPARVEAGKGAIGSPDGSLSWDVIAGGGLGAGYRVWHSSGTNLDVVVESSAGRSFAQDYWDIQYGMAGLRFSLGRPARSQQPPPPPPPVGSKLAEKPADTPVKPKEFEEPGPEPTPLEKAQALEEEGNYEGAAEMYRKLFEEGGGKDSSLVLQLGHCLEELGKADEAKADEAIDLYEDFLVNNNDPDVRSQLSQVYKGDFRKMRNVGKRIIGAFPVSGDRVTYVRLFVQSIIDENPEAYIREETFEDFKKKVLLPYACKGKVEELAEGLKQFFEVTAQDPSMIKTECLYALLVLKEFLMLSVDKSIEAPYGKVLMDERMGGVFYAASVSGRRRIPSDSKLGVNLYMQIILAADITLLTIPDNDLLQYFYEVGCHRPWIDDLRQKLLDRGRTFELCE